MLRSAFAGSAIALSAAIFAAGGARKETIRGIGGAPSTNSVLHPAPSQLGFIAPDCPKDSVPRVIEIRQANPTADRANHDIQRSRLVRELRIPNRKIVLGPNVVLDFTGDGAELPLVFGPCVILTSAASFRDSLRFPDRGRRDSLARDVRGIPAPSGPARTPHSRGPLLKFGPHSERIRRFLHVGCVAGNTPSDHVRISGFRVEGPSLGQQTADQFGILIERCLDVEVSNMEIFGWGGAGVRVIDDSAQGPGQEPPNNSPGDRIGRPEQVRIFNNYFHHNQHASELSSNDCNSPLNVSTGYVLVCLWTKGHAAGYGVDVHDGAWAQIYYNLFDVNRHAIAAAGRMGGYDARWNLVLKGGGYHGRLFNDYTHQFDIHGTGSGGFGGTAGVQTWYLENSFQYTNGPAINIRGRPHLEVRIGRNIFPHEGFEADRGDDAVRIHDRDDRDVVKLQSGNIINVDTYGRYGVCDFDGNGYDDLFLPTGRTWWFSSFGEFPWSYLATRDERLADVRLGYFDADSKCDVLTVRQNRWVISSGGTGQWTDIGGFDTRLDEVAFGRFDPNQPDLRPEATRRTTHALRRRPNGEWQITPLSQVAWTTVGSSSLPMNKLLFGDFTGDGVTDVLAVVRGKWAISKSAREPWSQLNRYLGDDVSSLLMADLNHDNVDDLIRLQMKPVGLSGSNIRIRYTLSVSDSSRKPWRELKRYEWNHPPLQPTLSGRAFAGRFGIAPGGGIVVTGPDRIGNFLSPAERAAGRDTEWRNWFGY